MQPMASAQCVSSTAEGAGLGTVLVRQDAHAVPGTPDALREPYPAGRISVLFLHGWGIGPQSYRGALARLEMIGCEVMAPAQPGFAGTRSLPAGECGFAGYARWAARYLDDLDVHEPVVVVGHSFGGGVALQLAHDFPERVRAAVLCNSVGGPVTWPSGAARSGSYRPMSERPLWEWGREFGSDLLRLPVISRVLPPVLGEAVPNIIQNPLALWRVASFVRRADLLAEAAVVAYRGTPLTVVWSDRDRLVPHGSFAALCEMAGTTGVVVPGGHGWLIADPDVFADVFVRAMAGAGVFDEALGA